MSIGKNSSLIKNQVQRRRQNKMIRLVIHIVLLAVVVAFVALNVPYSTSINLFGYMFEDISTVAVVLVAFIVGIIYSFFYYILNFFYKSGRKKDREHRRKAKDMEKELKDKERQLKSKNLDTVEQIAAPQDEPVTQSPGQTEGKDKPKKNSREKKGVFSRKKTKAQDNAEDS